MCVDFIMWSWKGPIGFFSVISLSPDYSWKSHGKFYWSQLLRVIWRWQFSQRIERWRFYRCVAWRTLRRECHRSSFGRLFPAVIDKGSLLLTRQSMLDSSGDQQSNRRFVSPSSRHLDCRLRLTSLVLSERRHQQRYRSARRAPNPKIPLCQGLSRRSRTGDNFNGSGRSSR